MLDGYSAFLTKFKDYYPEIYLKLLEFPDPIVIGWINELRDDRKMINLTEPEKVKEYFDMKIAVSKIVLTTKF